MLTVYIYDALLVYAVVRYEQAGKHFVLSVHYRVSRQPT